MLKSLHRNILAAITLLSIATAPVVAQSSKGIYRVTADAAAEGDGSSWQSPMSLAAALGKAVAGDEVWVKGYENVTDTNAYHAPQAGFLLRSGVKLYGGLRGDETTSAEAAAPKWKTKRYNMQYKSLLLADSKLGNDSVPVNYIIFPENPTRHDNARHCLVANIGVSDDNLNAGNEKTVVCGMMFAGGSASGSADSDDGHGGGLLITNKSTHATDGNAAKRGYEVTQCYFVDNYARCGGAIYVDPSVTNSDTYNNRIRYCGIYNNAAGGRSTTVNMGGGVWLGGSGVLCDSEVYNNTSGGVRLSDKAKVVNATIVHNTVTAVDLVDASMQGKVPTADGGGTIYNSVMWGSSTLSKTETKPAFRYSAYPEVEYTNSDYTDANHNKFISFVNADNEKSSARFVDPTSNVGYDLHMSVVREASMPNYTFSVDEESGLINAGNIDYYKAYVASNTDNEVDLAGGTRYYMSHSIDIGAFEYEIVQAGRRLYVKPAAKGGNDGNDGLSWDNALASPQTAIDRLARDKGRKGEVWVAAGVYSPTHYMVSDSEGNRAQTAPLAFQMRDGISVFGGFAGTETAIDERKLGTSGKAWDFVNRTTFRGDKFTTATWNANDEAWSVASDSYHVVWFAVNPFESADSEFSMQTILDGVTVEGGKASENGMATFDSKRGSGIYMVGQNTYVRNCVVRNNSAVVTDKSTTQGGGIYCSFGQVRGSLVYNNTATEGGGVYVERAGFVNGAMVANNSGTRGSGVYLDRGTSGGSGNMQILVKSIVANNTSTGNGAVYANGSGLIEQCTIANNFTSNVTDIGALSPTSTSYTAGLFVDSLCTVVNSIFWNNSLRQSASAGNKRYSASLANVYATNHTRHSVNFFNNAISEINAINWADIYQTGSYELTTVEFNRGNKTQYTQQSQFNTLQGVQGSWTDIDYFWQTRPASILRNRGLLYGQLTVRVDFKPSTDFDGKNFEDELPIGPYVSYKPEIVFDSYTKPGTLRLYYDNTGRTPQGNGSSWAEAYTSLNDLLDYIGELQPGSGFVNVYDGKGETSVFLDEDYSFEILVREGSIEPNVPYTFQENDAQSCCFNVKANPLPLTILGGYPPYEENSSPADADRNPAKYRTEFTGNANGSALSEGKYHVFRIETGANITLDGVAVTRGYAAGTSYMPQGAGVIVGSLYAVDKPTYVTLRGCIIENNTAYRGPAIATMDDLEGATLRLENCVFNNNQSNDEWIIYRLNESCTFTMDYVSFINNVGKAPERKYIGNTSFAAGNMLFDSNFKLSTAGANNTLDIATTGKEGAANFANPTNKVGAAIGGNVYYGGNACFRPLTSSADNTAIINRAGSAMTSVATDIAGNERDLGGAPDLGAYEALLPKAGKVIYVRSYNTDWTEDDWIDGTPDFNILKENPGTTFDGLTWDRAIQGNAVCDTTKMYDGNDMYVLDGGKMMAATLDNTKYGADYNASSAPYGQTSNAYGGLFSAKGNEQQKRRPDGTLYNKITDNRDERYVSGLQIAVERAARYNAAHKDDAGYEEMSVWVGAGVYTDFKGFVIRNGVKVYGGFPKTGNPGENERRPLLSQYVPARKGYENLNKADYETVLQVRKETPVYLTKSSREMWWSEGKPSDGSDYDYIQKLVNSGKTERHYVLYQPDVCLPTWGVTGDERGSYTAANQYRCKGFGNYEDDNYREFSGVKWDGFSIRHGYITNYSANRDGGAGVRVFRGIKLENIIVVNNISHGSRSRGGGLYMDGDNSTISNSFLLRNIVWGNKDNYGGGAYMIQGVGYNMVVASNRSYAQGGGIFIESAKFYNNTVAYNMSNNTQGTGIMHWQDNATGIASSLTLYNCLVYDNMKNNGVTSGTTQVGTSAAGMFNRAYNCYVNGNMGSLASKFSKDDGNVTLDNYSSVPCPFALKGNDSSSQGTYVDGGIRFSKARAANNYRLNEGDGLAGNPCLNGGTEDMPAIPATDMDYTDRIKDCTIDIGAYEADNSANIAPQAKTAADGTKTYVYYVTETGYGNRSGSDPENAACAEKLQSVLTAAGQLADSLDYKYKVYVKVAGYETDEAGDRFVYHVNTLADPDDPQSYTFLVPQGVWMMGGYNEGTWQTVTTGSGTNAVTTRRLTGYNWDNDARDVITSFQTILSAKTQPRQGSAVDEVTGLHVVSFGKWPKGEIADYYRHALPGKTVDGKLVNPTTGIDGVRLIDGDASDNAGFNAMGGGAVVPAYAHVRNCAITNCQAMRGGALAMLPGGIVSGSVIHDNEARYGGAVYAANGEITDGTAMYRAYMSSCTICENTASEGGGIYQELGALFVGNTVVWGNTASADKNISGVLNEKFKDYIHHSPDETSTVTDYYPYNNDFVERRQLPANTENTEMTSDLETYFASTGEFYPRPYSQLIGNGVTKAYQRLWEKLGVATHDVKGQARGLKDRLTCGAYAVVLPDVEDNVLLTRLFVSADGGAEVSDELKNKYMGRSFYTPFNSLDAALAYISHTRTNNIGTATSPKYLADESTHFDILISGGTYRPTVVRTGSDVEQPGAVVDRRMQTFEIPVNVAIFGSFMSDDNYSSDPVDPSTGKYIDGENLVEVEKLDGSAQTLRPRMSITDILKERNSNSSTADHKNHREDLNKNKLLEPWEFANPTVLSGDIKASDKERKVYHVVYSNVEDDRRTSIDTKYRNVLLDGITIANGETSDSLATDDDAQELVGDMGHGGGIFAYNVDYMLSRCRVIRNTAVHGGGIFVHDANLAVIGSAVSGNHAGPDVDDIDEALMSVGRGGGICADYSAKDLGCVAVINSLLSNNTADGSQREPSLGGAIYLNLEYGDGGDAAYSPLKVVNSLVVHNRALVGAEVGMSNNAYADNAPTLLFNTVCWGNESLRDMANGEYKSNAHMLLYDTQMSHCALDVPANVEPTKQPRAKSTNISIDRQNLTASGPRFSSPSKAAGYENFDIMAQWNPASISLLTDAGCGKLPACNDAGYDAEYEKALNSETPPAETQDAYLNWWQIYKASVADFGYAYDYIEPANASQAAYRRYMGPLDENTGEPGERLIDIGMYEFQYKFTFADMEAVYIGLTEEGDGSGDSWRNQSTDLHGAIVAMANPSGNTYRPEDKGVTDRHVYVRGGEYSSPVTTGGDAYTLIVNSGKRREYVTSVEIVGACTGIGHGDGVERDFSKQTVIVPNAQVAANEAVTNLLNVTTNGRPVKISGLTFQNTHECTGAVTDRGGRGVNATVNNDGTDQNGKLTIANCGFRHNVDNGLNVYANDGELLVYNTLFADGKTNGLNAKGKTTVVNCTFAKNAGADYTDADDKTSVYNSVAWENGMQTMQTDDEENGCHNTAFAKGTANGDVINGPNFSDPANGDYTIMSGLKLFNTGDSTLYVKKVFGISSIDNRKDYFSAERDLADECRLVGGNIDRGAYEAKSKLLPIIYVKTGVSTYGSGESWQKPLGDLQTAVNLAELYANTDNKSKTAYVFVDCKANVADPDISLPGVKVYGTMNEETSDAGGDTEPSDYDEQQINAIVAELLSKRKGTIEQQSMSRLGGLTMDYSTDHGSSAFSKEECVVDGFLVNGNVSLKRGYLSTSVLAAGCKVDGTGEGTLYNSLALGRVSGVRSVNVTAVKDASVDGSGTLPDVKDSKGNGCAANRVGAAVANRYVADDYWRWQLNDFFVKEDGTYDYSRLNADIDANADSTQTVACANAVGHRRDLAGNLRLRMYPSLEGDAQKFDYVDNGCFETWYLPTTYTATECDYPHGQSVIYVREEQDGERGFCELRLKPGMYGENDTFSPGFLLLKHHAGLRGNGNWIRLNNFAVERNFNVHYATGADGSVHAEGYPDLVVMPFSTTKREQFENGVLEADGTNDLYTSYAYNGNTRAAYDYKYDATDSKAWEQSVLSTDLPTQGLMIMPRAKFILRFYSNSYVERKSGSSITLLPYCFQEPWSTAESEGVKFTHKENMGWNLFGSPYLCAMNYSDMKYNRVIYVADMMHDDAFVPLNTLDADGSIVDGYIPACDAVFTQTATLRNNEVVVVAHSPELLGGPYAGALTMTVQLSLDAATRSAAGTAPQADALRLNAVDSDEAHTGFDMSEDGVKWMSAGQPQIYAVSGEGRYSLLSAVSREGEVKVGVSLPEAGVYSFAVPDGCDASGYEAVMLKDSKTGRAVDLLDGSYRFTADAAGEQNARFSISFHKTGAAEGGIVVKKAGEGRVRITGLQPDDDIRIYTPDGKIANMARSTSDSVVMATCVHDNVAIVEVVRSGRQVAVRKLK